MSTYLHKSGIILDIKGNNKKDILTGLAEGVIKSAGEIDNLIEDLVKRESLKTTGIGNGVAFPHHRSDAVNEIYMSIGISKQGLLFDAIDDKPVNLFFLVVCPENLGVEQMKLISRIARQLKEKSVREKLKEMNNADELISYLERIF